MLRITDITGESHNLTGVKQVSRTKKVNGEKTITFLTVPHEGNAHSFDSVDTESRFIFDGEPYIIKTIEEKSAGNTSIKKVDAVHVFYNDMINSFQYEQHTGSQTFFAALTRVFENTIYDFSIVDSFTSETFENFGMDNCLALFKNVLDRYGAEFEVIGKHVYLKRRIGENTGFQLRWKSNIKAIAKHVDTEGLGTVIKGFGGTPDEKGVYPIVREHRSNVGIFSELISKPVINENLSTIAGMDARLKKVLIDESQLSITIDVAAVDDQVKNEGDSGYIIYEPMKIKLEARAVELHETFQLINKKWKVTETAATFANLRNKLTDVTTRFAQTTKKVDRLFEGKESLPYNVLPEAIRIAAEAINNSMTEIQYPPGEGIVLIDPNNPLNRVRLTSAGIGLSTDGGITYRSALTGAGIVTNELVAGIIRVNNIQIVGENDLFYWNGEGLFAYDPKNLNRYVRLNSKGLYIARGAITIERHDGYKTVDDGMSVFDVNIQAHSPDFKSDPVETVGYWYRTFSLNEQNCNYFRYRHQARYLKVEIGAVNEGGGATIVTVERGSQGVGNREVLATYRTTTTDFSNELTLTVDLGVPTGEPLDFYVRLKTTNEAAGARARIRGRWLEG